MPYILQKRNDIPAGLLQTLELSPNETIREEGYQPVGQTGYRLLPTATAVALTNAAGTITFDDTSEGLVAWFLTNVNDGAGAFATGTATLLTVAVGNSISVGPETFVAVAGARTSGANDFSQGGTDIADATDLVAAINDDANWVGTRTVIASNVGGTSAVVTITALTEGTAGNAIALAQVGGTITLSGATLAGGLDANSLTTVEASTNANDILAELGFGVLTAAAVLTLAAMNAAITWGALTAPQVEEVLDILAGRQYAVPAGPQIETGAAFVVAPAAGATGGPGWDSTRGFRRIYDSGKLRVSFNEGRLSLMSGATFTYLGATGAAVAVYNNDGSLYTGI